MIPDFSLVSDCALQRTVVDKKRQEKLAMRVQFTESEITKMFTLITEDIAKLGGDSTALKRLQENMKKMELYIKKGVEKIKR